MDAREFSALNHNSPGLTKALKSSVLRRDKYGVRYPAFEAIEFYKSAIELLNQLPENEETKKKKFEVLALIAHPLGLLGFPEDSLGMFQEGARLSKALGDERSLAKFYNVMGMYYSTRGDPQMGIKYSVGMGSGNAVRSLLDSWLKAPWGIAMSRLFRIQSLSGPGLKRLPSF